MKLSLRGKRDCVRTTIERKRWNKHHQNSSRVAAECESPARKCRVKCNKSESPIRDDTRSHTDSKYVFSGSDGAARKPRLSKQS